MALTARDVRLSAATQVFVGCMFCVILHTLWAIATVHRLFVKPEALKRCRPSSRAAAAAAAAPAPAVAASVTGPDSKLAADKQDKAPIMIRAVATSTEAVKPIMVYNEAAKGTAQLQLCCRCFLSHSHAPGCCMSVSFN
jgi:predicted cobalt transporter CbtA